MIKLILLIFAVVLIIGTASEPRNFETVGNPVFRLKQKLSLLHDEEEKIQEEIDDKLEENGYTQIGQYFPDQPEDPCEKQYCEAGMECIVDDKGKATCQCVKSCLEFNDDRRMVCSNFNTTWPSDCKLHQMRCLCSIGDSICPNEKYKHAHIDYYGMCQEPKNCEDEEFADFPRRMREWLFNIMTDMIDHQGATESFKKLGLEAEKDESKKWINAALWEWCMLDGQPPDRMVSRHELFPLRAPLYTMEHCIAPFLDSCDPNNDHKVSLKEWVACLQLNEDGVDRMEELCDEIRPM